MLIFSTQTTKTHLFSGLEPADGMVKATLKQLWKRFNVFYMASDLYL